MLGEGKEWYIACPWGRIAIIAWGDCRSPPVLLAHGKLDSAMTFAPLVRMLPDNYYYVALDFPGNGKSDWMPPGMPVSTHDLTYSVKLVIDHFRWKTVAYIGHSLGALMGYQYNTAYPGRLSKLILIDPIPAYDTYSLEEIPFWYKKYIQMYFHKDNFHKFNMNKETAPLYTREKIIDTMTQTRFITRAAAEELADRVIERDGNRYRFTFDQRMKKITRPPLTLETMERLYTSMTLPILVIAARDCIRMGGYRRVPFIFKPERYPNGNYRVCKVDGNHDVHLVHPERVAPLVASFLEDVKAKL